MPYPTTLHSEQKCVCFCSEWSIVGYGTGAFWNLWIRSIRTVESGWMLTHHRNGLSSWNFKLTLEREMFCRTVNFPENLNICNNTKSNFYHPRYVFIHFTPLCMRNILGHIFSRTFCFLRTQPKVWCIFVQACHLKLVWQNRQLMNLPGSAQGLLVPQIWNDHMALYFRSATKSRRPFWII